MLHTARVAGVANRYSPVHTRRSVGTALVRGRYGPSIRWWLHPNGAPQATGVAVQSVTDYSGNNLSITQPGVSSKYPLKGAVGNVPSFAFDGVNDGFVTGVTNLSSLQTLTVGIADYRGNVSGTLELELTADATNIGTTGIACVANDGGVNGWEAVFRGNVNYQIKNVASASAPTQTWRAWVQVADKSQPAATELKVFQSGQAVTNFATVTTSDNTNFFANDAWYIGCRANTTAFFTGSLTQIVVLTQALSDSEAFYFSLFLAQAAGIT